MIIGVRAHDYGKRPIEALLRAIAADGWQAVQLAFPKAAEGVEAFGDVTSELIEHAKAELYKTRLKVAVLGVYIEPSFIDEPLRRGQAAILRDALPQCAALGAACIGTETTAMRKQPGVSRGEALRALRRTLGEVLPEAERLRAVVAVEPVHCHALATPELARELLLDMRSPALKLIFDPVNLLRHEDIDSQDALWARCAELMGGDIAAVHIKGALRAADADGVLATAPLEASVVDYRALAARLKGVDAPVLREEATPEKAAEDIAFIGRIWNGA